MTDAAGTDATGTGARVAVIGDIGGHAEELYSALVRLGADGQTLDLPPDLVVVQVGDLIHRGPDSVGVLAMVEEIMQRQPRQWVQLAGNHEAQYLTASPRFQWPETLDSGSSSLLRDWWRTGKMTVAVALSSPTGDWLITHGGLTKGYWEQALGEPPSAALAAKAMNSFIGTEHEPVLLRGGVMIEGRVDMTAGPVWAEAGSELISSWAFGPVALPFNQAHGHSSLYAWDRRRWTAAAEVTSLASLDYQRRHVTLRLGDQQVVGVDPGLGYRGGVPWEPLVLAGARVL